MIEFQSKRTLGQRISQPFIAGVLGFLPLALTLAVLAWCVVFLHDLVGPQSAFGRILAAVGSATKNWRSKPAPNEFACEPIVRRS